MAQNPIPKEWLPNVPAHAVVVHWTGGNRQCSGLDKKHYHLIIDGELKIHRGNHSIADNLNLNDGDYAAHTRSFNARGGKAVIGISLCGMAGATESPFRPGPFPILQEQWELLGDAVAQLSEFYNIPVDDNHILQHGEVQRNLGILQRGKWDICKLPWAPLVGSKAVCDSFRTLVRQCLSPKFTDSPKPQKSPRLVLALKKNEELKYVDIQSSELRSDNHFYADPGDIMAALLNIDPSQKVMVSEFLKKVGAVPYDYGDHMRDLADPRMYAFIDIMRKKDKE